jgi:hypothetical protein
MNREKQPPKVITVGNKAYVATRTGFYRLHERARELRYNMHLERNERDGKCYPPGEAPF